VEGEYLSLYYFVRQIYRCTKRNRTEEHLTEETAQPRVTKGPLFIYNFFINISADLKLENKFDADFLQTVTSSQTTALPSKILHFYRCQAALPGRLRHQAGVALLVPPRGDRPLRTGLPAPSCWGATLAPAASPTAARPAGRGRCVPGADSSRESSPSAGHPRRDPRLSTASRFSAWSEGMSVGSGEQMFSEVLHCAEPAGDSAQTRTAAHWQSADDNKSFVYANCFML